MSLEVEVSEDQFSRSGKKDHPMAFGAKRPSASSRKSAQPASKRAKAPEASSGCRMETPMRPDGRYVGQEHPFFEIPTRGRGKRSGRSGAKGRLPSTGRTRALHGPARPYFPDAVSAMRRRAVDNDELLCHEDMDGDSPLEAARAKADLFCYEEMEKKKMPCKIIKLPSKKDEKQTKEVETSSFIHAPFPLPPLSPAPAQFSRKNPCLDKLVRQARYFSARCAQRSGPLQGNLPRSISVFGFGVGSSHVRCHLRDVETCTLCPCIREKEVDAWHLPILLALKMPRPCVQ